MDKKKVQSKILVCSGVNGQINSFIDHVEGLFVKKGPFDYVFCIGDFFGDGVACEKEWEEFKNSGITVSVPIYTLGPNKKEHEKYFKNLQDQQLAPNIYYLGKDGVFNTSEGLRIGYISGIQNESNKENEMHLFNYDSLAQFKDSCLRSGCSSLDILLTSPWPLDVRNKERIAENLQIKEPTEKSCYSQLVSWVAIHLTPRYHFASLQKVFYQRSPYKNTISNSITRFIGLGDFNDKSSKQKWLYGFVLSPVEFMSGNKINYTVTESPYADDPSQYISNLLPASKQFFYNTSTNMNFTAGPPKKKKFGGLTNVNQTLDIDLDKCWFCLSGKNISKHMIISIGSEVYLAGTKGPLITEHLLIAPINHYRSFADLPPATENEINLIKSALNKYFKSTGRYAVYFERNILSPHCQLQVVPVPERMLNRLEDSFKVTFKQYDLKLVDLPPTASLRQIAKNGEDNYFYIELPNGKRLFHSSVNKSEGELKKFPVHIAREVLASPRLLNVEDHIDWKKCQLTVEDEKAEVVLFRTAFSPYNPLKDD